LLIKVSETNFKGVDKEGAIPQAGDFNILQRGSQRAMLPLFLII
jgi:hypothetical protein